MNSTKYARRSRSTSVCVNRTTSASIYGLTLTGQDRLQWTQRSQRWLQWPEVLFRDKSRFHLRGNDGRIRTWRRGSEWYANCCVREAERWAGGSVMVWALPFVIAHRWLYHCTALYQWGSTNSSCPVLCCPSWCHLFSAGLSAISHSARITTAFLRQHGINMLPCPAFSTNLICGTT